MTLHTPKERILILGASGFIGNVLYKELCGYYKTFGTYHTQSSFTKNKNFIHYNHERDDLVEILSLINPTVVISALRGNLNTQVIAHRHLVEYVKKHSCKIIFLSGANVFDAYSQYPSYETDKTLSNSIYGHFKIKIENALMLNLPKYKWCILRLPMVFGSNSPRTQEIKTAIKENTAIDVFPNLVINVTCYNKLAQQLHYIVNRKKYGIYHLGSTDLVYHADFITEITSLLTQKKVSFKQVFTTNNERYLAVLPKNNLLPKHLQMTSHEVLKELSE